MWNSNHLEKLDHHPALASRIAHPKFVPVLGTKVTSYVQPHDRTKHSAASAAILSKVFWDAAARSMPRSCHNLVA